MTKGKNIIVSVVFVPCVVDLPLHPGPKKSNKNGQTVRTKVDQPPRWSPPTSPRNLIS